MMMPMPIPMFQHLLGDFPYLTENTGNTNRASLASKLSKTTSWLINLVSQFCYANCRNCITELDIQRCTTVISLSGSTGPVKLTKRPTSYIAHWQNTPRSLNACDRRWASAGSAKRLQFVSGSPNLRENNHIRRTRPQAGRTVQPPNWSRTALCTVSESSAVQDKALGL